MFYLGFSDMLTFGLFVASLIVVFGAQYYINSSFKKYRTTRNQANITGFEAARKILDQNDMKKIHIVEVKQDLADHYDPTRKVIRLSTPIFHESSIAAVAIAAHEVGHAIQDKENYVFLRIRAALVPVVNLVSYMGYFAILVALLAGAMQYFMFGIYILLATFVFQLVTLPVELDASRRANEQLLQLGIIESSEKEKTKAMLTAAALTYVAALIATLLNILRLWLMSRGR